MKRKLLLSLLGFFIIIFSSAQVKISEVYFDTNFNELNGDPIHHYGEFVELYNRSNQSIDISNWKLNDNYLGFNIPQGTIIEPQSFIIIANGTTLGTYTKNFPILFSEASGKETKIIYQQSIELNNQSDFITLKDNTGKIIDELRYTLKEQCIGSTANSYCYKTTIDNQNKNLFNAPIEKAFTYSIQRQNFDNNTLLVTAKATPFSLLVADNYAGNGSSGNTGTGTGTAPTFTDDNYIYSRTYLTPVTAENPSAQQIQAIQYFDGLGRLKQSIAIKATPLGNDMVTPVEYDGFGRQVKDFLPLPQSVSGNGALNTAPETTYYSTAFPGARLYSEKKLELSPLDRVQEQGHPGTDWNIGSTHTQKFDYGTNDSLQVRKYVASFNYTTFVATVKIAPSTDANADNGFYKKNQLYKNTVTDEDGNISIEFKNGQGQTLLVRKNDGVNNVDTYYVYNDYDQLAYVIPPLAANKYKNLAAGTTILSTDADLSQLCYQYKYDVENRLVEKKLPGKGWEYMVYDKQDRLVATQDANMRAVQKWLFTKYDKFGRVAYTGIVTTSLDRLSYQNQVNLKNANNESRIETIGFTRNTLGAYYTATGAYPPDAANVALLSVNYYDEYPIGIPYLPTSIESQTVNSKTSQGTASNTNAKISTKGLALASFVKNIEDDKWTKSYTYYDLKARPIGTYSENYLGGYTKTATKLKFSGKPEYTYTYHKKGDRSDVIAIKETFEYDNQERVLKHWHQVNNGMNELLTDNKYNELGQLDSKKVGGTIGAPLQTVDYKYNIRGWMTQINNPNSLGDDLFGYKVKYNQVDGLQIPNIDYQNDKVVAKYNGNIAEIDWVTGTEYNPIKKRFGYVYDGLNRLIAGYYQPENNPSGKEYFERLNYDVNGNITELKRSGNIVAGYPTANLIDNLGYSYTGNQLTKVVDTSGKNEGYPSLATHNTILYDANGNMTKHLDKNISAISYNFLNLPKKVTEGSKNTQYLYRADGVKISKVKSTGGSTTYLDGFQYETEVLQFVPTAEGYYDFNLKDYIYNFTDHLGNVRLSYRAADGGGFEILEENNYYPFGLKFVNENLGTKATPSYNYKYNGKELQETGAYDFGARQYMSDIGRWGVVDPKGAEFPGWSLYNYSFNNPIRFTDPDGMAPNDIVFINNRGVEVHRIKSDTQFKTYIQATVNASSNPAKSMAGWKQVPMPNIIQQRPQSGENVSGSAYQENDYQIAARTGYFNQSKNSGQLDLVTEGGNPIPQDAIKGIPDLDPTLVKAVTVQESNAGTSGVSDIMQANVPGDWSKMKSSYQLTKGEKTSETNSLFAGTRILATKGFKGGISVDPKTGKISYKFQGWAKAVEAYNGGGTAGYQKSVLQMQQESKKPKPSDY